MCHVQLGMSAGPDVQLPSPLPRHGYSEWTNGRSGLMPSSPLRTGPFTILSGCLKRLASSQNNIMYAL